MTSRIPHQLMLIVSFLAVIISLRHSVSGQTQPGSDPATRRTTERAAPTTAPMIGIIGKPALSDSRLSLLEAQRRYQAKESPGRANLFSAMSVCLSQVQRDEQPMSETEVFEVLGLPDAGVSVVDGSEYVYLFDEGSSAIPV